MTAGLQLPASFYGLYRDVKREMSKVVTRLRRGEDWVAAIEARGFLDVATTPGLIVLDGPASILGGEDHFHTFVFWRLVMERLDAVPGVREQVFERSLTTVWGIVGLIGKGCPGLLYPRERHIPFLRAVVTCWDELEAVGRRYTRGLQYPDYLWRLPMTVGYVLANQGVPTPAINSLPPGGLLALIQRYGIDLTAPGENGGAP